MKKIFLFLLAFVMHSSFAQDGQLIASYAPNYVDEVSAIAMHTSGDLIVAGRMESNGMAKIVKITPNGTLDPNFNATYINNFIGSTVIYKLSVQSNGQILVAGRFTGSGVNKCLIRLSATGAYDGSFNPNLPTNYVINAVTTQLGINRIVVGGEYFPAAAAGQRIFRLLQTGAADTSFNSGGTGIQSGAVLDLLSAANGDLYIGGSFTSYNSIPRQYLAKVNGGGILVTAFNLTGVVGINNGPVDGVYTLAFQTDGKLLIGGRFIHTPTGKKMILRLIATSGIVDTTFGDPGVSDTVFDIALQSNGKIIIGGEFGTVGGTNRRWIARLLPNGTNDVCFDPGLGGTIPGDVPQGGGISHIVVDEDDNLYLCGYRFRYYNRTPIPTIAKVRGTSAIDAGNDDNIMTYNFTDTTPVNVLSNDSLGDIIPVPATSVTITPNSGWTSYVTLDTATGDVKVLAGAPPGTYTLKYTICQGTTTCYCDSAIVTLIVVGPLPPGIRANNVVNQVKLQSTNKIIIGGEFSLYNNQPANRLTRLNTDLTLDTSFTQTTQLSGTIGDNFVGYLDDVELQSDDKIVLGGHFNLYNGTPVQRLIRLYANGGLDTSFNPGGVGPYKYVPYDGSNGAFVKDLTILPNGNMVAIGSFDQYNSSTAKNIVGLNPDGTVDPNFVTGLGFGTNYAAVCEAHYNNVLVGGNFYNYNGTTTGQLIRLLPNGSIDPTFTQGFPTYYSNPTGFNFSVIKVQPDGKILVGGWFQKYNGEIRKNLVRLLPNGQVDPNFTIGTGFDNAINGDVGEVYAITLVEQGKIIVAGHFTTFDGHSVPNIVRLNSDGSYDASFSVGTGPLAISANLTIILALATQPDGRVLIGGFFDSFNGIYAGNVTRIIPASGIQARGVDYFVSEPAIDAFTHDTNDIAILANSKVSIYPNPSSGIFTLDMKGYEGQTFELVIHNALGQLVHQTTVKPENAYQIDLTNFQNGNYFVRLQNNSTTINKIISKQ